MQNSIESIKIAIDVLRRHSSFPLSSSLAMMTPQIKVTDMNNRQKMKQFLEDVSRFNKFKANELKLKEIHEIKV